MLYTTNWCGYCARARQLLKSKGVEYTEIDVESVDGARAEMRSRSGRTSVPQIFIGEHHVGGYDELRTLDARGELDSLTSRGSHG